MDLFIGLLECPYKMTSGFPQREQGGSHSMSYDLALKVTDLHFCNLLLITQVKSALFDLGRGNEYQGTKIIGAVVEAVYRTL